MASLTKTLYAEDCHPTEQLLRESEATEQWRDCFAWSLPAPQTLLQHHLIHSPSASCQPTVFARWKSHLDRNFRLPSSLGSGTHGLAFFVVNQRTFGNLQNVLCSSRITSALAVMLP